MLPAGIGVGQSSFGRKTELQDILKAIYDNVAGAAGNAYGALQHSGAQVMDAMGNDPLNTIANGLGEAVGYTPRGDDWREQMLSEVPQAAQMASGFVGGGPKFSPQFAKTPAAAYRGISPTGRAVRKGMEDVGRRAGGGVAKAAGYQSTGGEFDLDSIKESVGRMGEFIPEGITGFLQSISDPVLTMAGVPEAQADLRTPVEKAANVPGNGTTTPEARRDVGRVLEGGVLLSGGSLDGYEESDRAKLVSPIIEAESSVEISQNAGGRDSTMERGLATNIDDSETQSLIGGLTDLISGVVGAPFGALDQTVWGSEDYLGTGVDMPGLLGGLGVGPYAHKKEYDKIAELLTDRDKKFWDDRMRKAGTVVVAGTPAGDVALGEVESLVLKGLQDTPAVGQEGSASSDGQADYPWSSFFAGLTKTSADAHASIRAQEIERQGYNARMQSTENQIDRLLEQATQADRTNIQMMSALSADWFRQQRVAAGFGSGSDDSALDNAYDEYRKLTGIADNTTIPIEERDSILNPMGYGVRDTSLIGKEKPQLYRLGR